MEQETVQAFAIIFSVVFGSYALWSLYIGTRDGLRRLRQEKAILAERKKLLGQVQAARQAGAVACAIEPEKMQRVSMLSAQHREAA
ncbi:MAG TPA: hypothetical protein PKI03_33960 [Pseudomonadota bacterium]|nr:hypothetical protein [Pseudomonadota bacterium]